MTTSNQTVRGALLHDGHREAGTKEEGNRKFSWEAGYVVTLLPYGCKRGTEIQKYIVRSDLEATIKTQLENVEWGTLISLELEQNQIIRVSILQ